MRRKPPTSERPPLALRDSTTEMERCKPPTSKRPAVGALQLRDNEDAAQAAEYERHAAAVTATARQQQQRRWQQRPTKFTWTHCAVVTLTGLRREQQVEQEQQQQVQHEQVQQQRLPRPQQSGDDVELISACDPQDEPPVTPPTLRGLTMTDNHLTATWMQA